MSTTIVFAFLVGGVCASVCWWWVIRQQKKLVDQKIQQLTELELLKQTQIHEKLNTLDQELLVSQNTKQILSSQLDTLQIKYQEQEIRLASTSTEIDLLRSDKVKVSQEVFLLRQVLEEERRSFADRTRGYEKQIGEISSRLKAEQDAYEEKLAVWQNASATLKDQFKQLAQDVLSDKGKSLSETHSKELGLLLSPLKQQLEQFETRVHEIYRSDTEDRAKVRAQVDQLMVLNQQMTQEAHQLTLALKGSNKTQGNWGELILERLLELAGLREGIEFVRQSSHSGDDGARLQPDVVIFLPQGRCLVIDAKVSLLAYQRYVEADQEEDKRLAVKKHLESVRSHMKGLSGKQYEKYVQGQTLDFVLLFIPIEPAWSLAMAEDSSLYQDSWDKNVLLVSPSNLLFVLRTVSYLWKQEQQQNNAQEIAKKGAVLYDKLSAFVGDMDKLAERLEQAQRSLQDARTKLTGRGGAVSQAEGLRKMGVVPSKVMPVSWQSESLLSEELGEEGVGEGEDQKNQDLLFSSD